MFLAISLVVLQFILIKKNEFWSGRLSHFLLATPFKMFKAREQNLFMAPLVFFQKSIQSNLILLSQKSFWCFEQFVAFYTPYHLLELR